MFCTLFSIKAQNCINVNAQSTVGEETILLNCEGGDLDQCIDLQVEYDLIPSTETYTAQSIPYSPVIPFTQGISLLDSFHHVSNIIDDRFSPVIDLGFSFCYFNQNFDKIVVGSNGMTTFSQTYANTVCPSGIPGEIPNHFAISNAVYGPKQDFYFDLGSDSDILYEIQGEAPCRSFILNYYKARLFGCDETATFQIVFYEGTNEIEFYMQEKPLGCNELNSTALLGIINEDGSVGFAPPGRNTSGWAAAEEAWRMFPAGNIPPVITWTDDEGNVVGNTAEITVCVDRSNVYTVEVDYQSCENGPNVFTDSIPVSLDAGYPAIASSEIIVCDLQNNGFETVLLSDYSGEISANPVGNFSIDYFMSLNDAQNNINALTTINLTSSTTVYVRIQNLINTNCTLISPVTFGFISSFLDEINLNICDNENNGIEEQINILELFSEVINNSDLQLHIFTSEAEAQNGTNPVEVTDITSDSEFWLTIESLNCLSVHGPYTVNFNPAPQLPDIPDISFSACDINSDNVEPFDWDETIRNAITVPAGINLEYYSTYENAVAGNGSISNIRENYTEIFVRAENTNGCYSIQSVAVNVQFTGMRVRNHMDRICFNGNEDITFDLMDYYVRMIIQEADPYTFDFYASYQDALQQNSPIDNIQTISADGNLVFQDYYVRFQTAPDCYAIKRFRMNLLHPAPLNEFIEVCDENADDTETDVLSIYRDQIRDELGGTVRYFLTENDALTGSNALTEFTFTGSDILYIELNQYDCISVFPVTFILTDPELVADTVEINIESSCGTPEADIIVDLNDFNNEVYPGESEPTVTYFLQYDPATSVLSEAVENPEEHLINEGSVVYALISLSDNPCPLIATVQFHIVPHEPLTFTPADLYACDFEHDLNQSFDLSTSIPLLTAGIEGFNPDFYDISFHHSIFEAENDSSPLSVNFTPNEFILPIYVRFENIHSGCFEIATLNLNTLYSPKIYDEDTTVCDSNNDGLYELDLASLIPLVNPTQNPFDFTYFLSRADAESQENELIGIYESAIPVFDIWVRAENIEDCYGLAKVSLTEGEAVGGFTEELIYTVCDAERNGEILDLNSVTADLNLNGQSISYYENLSALHNSTPFSGSEITYSTAGSHTLYAKISEADLCPAFVEITVDLNLPPQLEIENIVACVGEEITVVPQLDGEPGSYTYAWHFNDQVISTDDNLSGNLEAGNYSLIISESGTDCPTEVNFTVSYEPPGNSTETFELIKCDVNNNGIRTFDLNEIAAQLEPNQTIIGFYSDNDLATPVSTPENFQNTQFYNDLVYALIGFPNECPKFYAVALTVLHDPEINVTDVFLCENEVQVIPEIINAEAELIFDWSFNGNTVSNQQNPFFNEPGIYELNVSYAADPQCVFTHQIEVKQNNFDFTLEDLTFCHNNSVTVTPVILNPEFQYTYNWLNSSGNSISDSLELEGMLNGTYTLQVTEIESQCTKSYEVTVNRLPMEVSNVGYELFTCNSEDILSFDLNDISTQMSASQIIQGFYASLDPDSEIFNPGDFQTSADTTIYVLVNEGEECPVFHPVSLSELAKPEVTFYGNSFCEGGSTDIYTDITPLPSNVQFSWYFNNEMIGNTDELTGVTRAGYYDLHLTYAENGIECTYIYETQVSELNNPEISEVVVHDDSVEIIAVSQFPLEYSSDMINWQSSNVFDGLQNGAYEFYVQYMNSECTSLPFGAYVFIPYNVITPNGDGKNDFFLLSDLHLMGGAQAHLRIFERSGKLVFEESSDTEIKWNGTFRGRPLPSGDYWYILDLPDGQRKSGHITIKNK